MNGGILDKDRQAKKMDMRLHGFKKGQGKSYRRYLKKVRRTAREKAKETP